MFSVDCETKAWILTVRPVILAETSRNRQNRYFGAVILARPLVFQRGEKSLALEMNKIDRSQLYGYKDLEVVDDQGNRCELATLAEDARTLVGSGSTALGWLDVAKCCVISRTRSSTASMQK